MDCSCLHLRDELSLDQFYQLLEACPEEIPELKHTKEIARKFAEGFGVVKYIFREPAPISSGEENLAQEVSLKLLELSRRLMDSHPQRQEEFPHVLLV